MSIKLGSIWTCASIDQFSNLIFIHHLILCMPPFSLDWYGQLRINSNSSQIPVFCLVFLFVKICGIISRLVWWQCCSQISVFWAGSHWDCSNSSSSGTTYDSIGNRSKPILLLILNGATSFRGGGEGER